ncbi:hypothetical protein EEL32_00775 [Brevibacillus laterosporus]|uniref:Uncharacterized protein n=1 Tax=Brevibacillus laterosporus TaxID=1465 RepID=A0A502J5S8_BRELA|nr:hypothetical protein [Brevibacillus laterosporus]QDX94489.1 hypothetical protein EEL30_20690 [Brevibacillus laterosporus]RAP30957.1 hypothetical protein C2W64_00129 [Brevibacillus laterosporus]TPG92936.1 hypothetical protein EEL32_00775 [Brevibacillus laterosporus]
MDSTRKSKLLIIGFLVVSVLAVVAAFFGFRQAKDANLETIKQAIAQQGGQFTSAAVIPLEKSPFDKSNKGNTIYQVEYQKANKSYTAYYRAFNELSIIREPEKWIYPEEKK